MPGRMRLGNICIRRLRAEAGTIDNTGEIRYNQNENIGADVGCGNKFKR